MSKRKHGSEPPKVRNKQPDLVRKAGPHFKPADYTPEVCYVCGGSGTIDGITHGTEACYNCNGAGEL